MVPIVLAAVLCIPRLSGLGRNIHLIIASASALLLVLLPVVLVYGFVDFHV
jgi:hypothetical protein